MARPFSEPELILATHNANKLREVREILCPHNVSVVSAGELDLPEPVEDGDTFEANALIKARSAVAGSGRPALADDSGLVVNGLDGRPGIHSARWATADGDHTPAMERIQNELGENPDRTAHFACVLALAWPDGHWESFAGTVEGTLTWPPRGPNGFGYDPMFIPEGHDITFGEFAPADKQAISHRARALRQLVAACFRP